MSEPPEPASPGHEIAELERAFWEARRAAEQLPEGDAAQRRRLARKARKMHLALRSHRHARRESAAP